MQNQTEDRPVVLWNPLWAVVYVVLTYFASQIISGLLIVIYPHLSGWSSHQTQAWLSTSVLAQFIYVLIAEAVTIGAVVLFLRRYKAGLPVIGLKKPRPRDGGIGLLGYAMYFVLFAVMVVVVTHFIPSLNVSQKQEIGFDSVQGNGQLILTFISLVILPPLTEEILIRGFLFTSLRKHLTFWGATLITSLIFASAHLPEGGAAGPLYIAALDTFILSLVLCWLREKTGSLWAGITVHAIKNGVAFVSLFILAAR